MRLPRYLITALACAAMLTAAHAEPVDLRPRWDAGQTALYEFWTQREQRTTMSLGGNSREATMIVTTEGHTRWTVDQVNDDGSATCTMTLEWITAQIVVGDQKQTNDSRKGSGDSEAMHKLLRAMAGAPLTIEVNADGSIASVDGLGPMKTQIGAELEDLIPEPLDFVESASDLATLPQAPAAADPGDTFKADYRWTHELGHTDQSWTYELVSVDELEGTRVATVTGEGSIRLDVDRSEIPADAPPTDIRMTEGEASTQVFFDLNRHEAVGRHGTQDTTIEVNITLPNNRGKLQRITRQTIQSQVLRIEESG